MTSKSGALAAAIAQLGHRDPFSDALRDRLSLPASKAVRTRFVIEIVAELHDSLTSSFVTEPEAYQTFALSRSSTPSCPRVVALRFGERPEVAYVLPISVDGMLVVASAAMVEDKRSAREVRWSAR